MALAFQKLAAEVRRLSGTYTTAAEIQAGDVLVGTATVSASPSGLTCGTATVSVADNTVSFYVSGGTAGTTYTVTCLADTVSGGKIAAQTSVEVVSSLV